MSSAAASSLCHYCSLPLPAASHASAEEPRYCCFGCKLAAGIAGEQSEEGHTRQLLTRLGVAVFFSMNVMALTMALWSQEWNSNLSEAARISFDLLRYGCLLLSLPVLLLLGGPLLASVRDDLRHRSITADLLIAAGVIAAYGYSLVSVWQGSGHVYFEVACMVLSTLTLGRYLEATGKLKTTQVLRELEKLLPEQVRLVSATGEALVSAESIQAGDHIRVLPGERVAVDGVITAHSATLDEQVVTGESFPVVKAAGDQVYSGSLNLDGNLVIEATSTAGAGALQSMIEAVLQAASSRERYGRLADRITRWFLPTIFVIATVTLALHWQWHGLAPAILAALAVVLIACPCALGLATPMALWSALGRASQMGVLVREGDTLSRLAEINAVCFDKTGTLTTGQPRLAGIYLAAGAEPQHTFALAKGMAAATSHPLARTLHLSLADSACAACQPQQAQTLPGRGVVAEVESVGEVLLGSLRFLVEQGIAIEPSVQSLDLSIEQAQDPAPPQPLTEVLAAHATSAAVALAYNQRLQAAFLFEEELRSEAAAAIAALQQQGLAVRILTGDRQGRAQALARQLNVPAVAELLPAEKLQQIEQWKQQGERVLMIGDGLNDGPALTAADVSVAMGCGADIARELADVCLLGNELSRLPEFMQLARQTVGTIRWNLLWAFGYNTLGVLLAAAGWLHPIVAAAAMVVSSLLVVSNSLRLAGRAAESQDYGLPGEGIAPALALERKQPASEADEFNLQPLGSVR